MPRIPFPTPATMNNEQRQVYDKVIGGPRGELRGPLLAALHRPELADKWEQLGELLRFRTSLSPRHSEVAILVTAYCFDCPFEWYMHEPFAIDAGVPPELIEAIRTDATPNYVQDDDRIVYNYVQELHRDKRVSDIAYNEALSRFGVVGVVELTALVGYYSMVAMTLNAHEFETPDSQPI